MPLTFCTVQCGFPPSHHLVLRTRERGGGSQPWQSSGGAPSPGRAGPGALRQLPAALASSRLPDLGVVFAWSPLLSHQTRDLISSSDPLFLPV